MTALPRLNALGLTILVPLMLAGWGCGSNSGSGDSGETGGAGSLGGNSSLSVGGGPSSGGSVAVGGTSASGTGGSTVVSQGGSAVSRGGSTAAGGAVTYGGSAPIGGTTSSGGSVVSGGATAAGGSAPLGGSTSSGGASPVGGSLSTGGATAAGGADASGGADAAGGADASGGAEATGGTDAIGGSDSVGGGGAGVGGAVSNPLADLVPSAEEIGLLLANRFNQQNLAYSTVTNLPGDGYKSACEWYGALGVANLTGTQSLLDSLVSKFDSFKGTFIADMTGGEAHVDRYIYGMVPLEIYLQTEDESYLPLGTEVADNQQVTDQTRDAIDDMFMMTGLQIEAYRATGDAKYIDFMASTMVDYLGSQQSNGLFFHNVTQAPVHWGRGNGWFAAGMAEIMRDLPPSHADYPTILAGYLKMMEGLLPFQGENGMWYQVINMPTDSSNWPESSSTAMFTYAMIAGVKRGILDADTYVPVIQNAWEALRGKISATGNVSDICVGTWYKSTPQEYMALTRLTGDGHGQAPVLWCAAEILR